MTLARFINKIGVMRFIEGKVDGFTYLKYFTKDLKNPNDCEHEDCDQYNQYELLCLECGMIIDSIESVTQ